MHIGFENCKIYFDGGVEKYRGGDTISGRIEVDFEESKNIIGLEIQIIGVSKTSWTESTKNDEDKKYQGEHEYFKKIFFIIGADGSSNELIKMDSGNHIYPFIDNLPRYLPSSFEGAYGFVRYQVQVTLHQPLEIKKVARFYFIVESPIETIGSSIYEPTTLTIEKRFQFLCCRSGPLIGSVYLTSTGFECRQIIPFQFRIENNCNTPTNEFMVELCKITIFKATLPLIKEKKLVDVLQEVTVYCPVGPRASTTINSTIEIPDFIIPNLKPCNVIEINYELRFTIKLSTVSVNVSEVLPIFPTNNGARGIKF